MNACLIGKFGAIGASIGTVIAELTVTLIQMYFVRKDFNLKKVFKIAKNYLISSIVMFIVCVFIGRYINNNLVSTIVQVIIGGLTYGICLLIMRDKFVFEMLNRVKNRIKGN